MILKLKTALEYPLKDVESKGVFSIDVLILFGGELHIGYYDFKNFEWQSTDSEIKFRPEYENELQWTNIPKSINQK
jgi:hypothetical protein